jgi:hypothetical protein
MCYACRSIRWMPRTPNHDLRLRRAAPGFRGRLPSVGEKRIPFKIEVPNINQLYVDQMREDLLSWPGFNYQNWQTAAKFCADNKINLEEALVWADKAIHEPFRGATAGVEDFSTLSTKAAVLGAMGRTAEADAVMDKALDLPNNSMLNMRTYGVGLLRASRTDRALKILLLNQQRHPEELPRFCSRLHCSERQTERHKKLGDRDRQRPRQLQISAAPIPGSTEKGKRRRLG